MFLLASGVIAAVSSFGLPRLFATYSVDGSASARASHLADGLGREGRSRMATPWLTAMQAEGEADAAAAVDLVAAAVGKNGSQVRVGVLTVPGTDGASFWEELQKLNITNETFFQTEVPAAFQMPLSAKLLAMSNTVDVIIAAHGTLKEDKFEILRAYQTVALTTNVPIVPFDAGEDIVGAASAAVKMAAMRRAALNIVDMGKGGTFFGIGKNETKTPGKKEKVYF